MFIYLPVYLTIFSNVHELLKTSLLFPRLICAVFAVPECGYGLCVGKGGGSVVPAMVSSAENCPSPSVGY